MEDSGYQNDELSMLIDKEDFIVDKLLKKYNKTSTTHRRKTSNTIVREDILVNKLIRDCKKTLSKKQNNSVFVVNSGYGREIDSLFTLLYFRDMKRILNSEENPTIQYRDISNKSSILNDIIELYNTSDNLAEIIKLKYNSLFKDIVNTFYRFVGSFIETPTESYQEMIQNFNTFKKFIIKLDPNISKFITKFNTTGYFDSISLIHIVYSRMISKNDNNNEFNSIHYLMNCVNFFIYFKFMKKFNRNQFECFSEFFNSDVFFDCMKYLIEYEKLFKDEGVDLLNSCGYNGDMILRKFEPILVYMMYGKYRNLINTNMKRFIRMNYGIGEISFVDIDDYIKIDFDDDFDNIGDTINSSKINDIYSDFCLNMDIDTMMDVTNVALLYLDGMEIDPLLYSNDIKNAGIELANTLNKNVI